MEEWNREWTTSTVGQQTKIWIPRIIPFKSKDMLKINRIALGLCIQFITGHNWLLRHKRYYLKNPNMDLTCRLCNEPNSTEDSSHIWSECTKLRAQRNKVLANSIRLKQLKPSFNQPFTWSPRQLCTFLREPSIAQLLVDHEGE